MNLREVVNQLPRTLANRYSDDFWLMAANTVLSNISDRGFFSWSIKDSYLPFDSDLLALEMPEHVRAVIKVRDQAGKPQPFEVRQRVVEFAKGLHDDSTTTQVATVVQSLGPLRTVLDIPVGHDGFAGWNIHRADFDGAVVKYDRQLTPTTLEIGHSQQRFTVGDTVTLYRKWIQIQWVGAFVEITTPLSEIYANHHLLSEVLRLGLWYYALRQVSESGDEANTRFAEYVNAIDNMFCDNTRRTFKQKPRFTFRTFR
jgi:hypothetical protein